MLFFTGHQHHENLIIQALEENPKVFGTCWNFFSGGFIWSAKKLKITDLSLSKDVLMVFPAGNESITCASDTLGFDVHEAYPNVLWVAACLPEGTLEAWTNMGSLIDIAAPPLDGRRGTGISAFNVMKLVGQLRALRPEINGFRNYNLCSLNQPIELKRAYKKYPAEVS